ncbi:MAG: aldehyde dehydrogenase family protein, partial [Deltaproteobacteria bacterium]|nr:aldehyde dehydrogenase family protein [Deltaproteobacteria bacterium]
ARALLRAAAAAQQAWAREAVSSRAAMVRRVTEAIVQQADAMAEVLQRAQGMCRFDALVRELLPCVDAGQWYAAEAPTMLADLAIEPHLRSHRRGEVRFVPRGVVAVFSPWNAPLAEPLTLVFEALLAGNAVVWKPSSLAVLPALRAREIAVREGLPADLLAVLVGERDAGDAIIDAGVDLAVTIGSKEAARRVAARCARAAVPSLSTVAGKTTLIACDDCDVERAARAIVAGRFVHAGQRRDAVERAIVHASVAPALTRRVIELASALRVGDPWREAVDLGPAMHHSRATFLRVVTEEALRLGATLGVGGEAMHRDGAGSWFAPTVLVGVNEGARAARETLHGPVLPVLVASSNAHALALADDGVGGPFAYVFTESADRAAAMADGLRASVVLHDDVFAAEGAVDAPMDAAGPGAAGTLHGADGLTRMCRAQHRSVPSLALPARDPAWPPYTPLREQVAIRALRTVFGRHGVVGRLADLF